MTMQQSRFAVIALVAFGALWGHSCPAELTPRQTRAASVLFRQFETVVYTKGRFLLHLDAQQTNENDAETNLWVPFLELIAGLRALGPSTANDVLANYDAVLLGAAEFRSPAGLGAVSSQKCYIAVTEHGSHHNLAAQFRGAQDEAIEGREVWTWSIPPYEGHPQSTKFYAAQISSTYFMVTNNQRDFHDALSALTFTENL
ncbi:MAG: hypothetical protein JO356_06365, partial [Acidobacteria bacterium]|nr:hypothetical protein [Acidobacteriota bacterium]